MTSSTDHTAPPAERTAVDADVEQTDADDDLLFAPRKRAGLGRLTVGLIAAIVLVVAFGTGSWAQRHYGDSGSSGPSASGLPSGGFGGFPGAAGGTGAGTGSDSAAGIGARSRTGTASSGSGTASSGASQTPAVIGTVTAISGRTLTVKNLGGKKITVTVPETATVSSVGSLDGVSKGDSVTVVGTTGEDGDVTATSVTAR